MELIRHAGARLTTTQASGQIGAVAVLGPYELLRQVGTGGMGQVWLGRRTMVGGAIKTCAIKLLAARHVGSERHREMFLEEARLSISLDHSNILKVHEVGEYEGACYMAMDWLDGLTLAQLNAALRKRKQALPASVVGFILGEVLRALAYAHEADHRGTKQPIVHRDVTPQNVMLTVAGEVKLLDFGVARVVTDETSGLYIKGKPRYMSPEQFHGLSRGPIIDLFAVGALLHEMLDGGRVFRWQAGDNRLLEMVGAGRVPDLDVAGAPLELDALRRDLLAPEAQRLASARVALARLTAWSGYRDASHELQEMVRILVPPQDTTPEVSPTLLGPFTGPLDGSDEPLESILARLSEDELETQLRPSPPSAPPPPKLPERALEIDWIAVGRPTTGPNPIVVHKSESGWSRGLLVVLVVMVIVLAVIGATQLAR